jgi:FdrA protein
LVEGACKTDQDTELVMSSISNEVRKGTYLDSVALMRMSRSIAGMDGVEECGMMMGTPANIAIMRDAGVLNDIGEAAAPGDLVIAVRAATPAIAALAMADAKRTLDAPKSSGGIASRFAPRTTRAALASAPNATLALISVAGAFATAEAEKALNQGLNVLMFSDNVPIADELRLKQLAHDQGLLMMGPDCGTAIIGGTPLGFANVIPRGNIGIIGASGTGIQQVTCLIANNGGGITHAIGTGGRDLKIEIGGITTLMAIDLLDADPATGHIVIISKPPAAEVAARILARVGVSKKPFTICFIGAREVEVPANAWFATTLTDAAENALGRRIGALDQPITIGASGKMLRGLFAGGTLCAESQALCLGSHLHVASNSPIPGASKRSTSAEHTLLDLGDDDYTQGRPHPMIDPAVRDAPLNDALADPSVGAILLDVVLGYGASADPAGHLVRSMPKMRPSGPRLFVSIVGTDGDPQGYGAQHRTLSDAGIDVFTSNAAATRAALRYLGSAS